MTDWVRLWHDMPTDPKWRVIARKSGQRIGDVIAVFNFVMVNASANASERGRTHNLFAEDIGAALDLSETDVQAILDAMKGKVICSDGKLLGWEKRQPKREDNSAARAKAWREERKRTQANASERPETETELDSSEGKPSGAEAPPDPLKELFDLGVSILTGSGNSEKQARSLIGKWREGGKRDGEVLVALLECRSKAISEPVEWLTKRLQAARWVSKSGYEYRGSDSDVLREAERRGDMDTYWSVKAAIGRAKEAKPAPRRTGGRRGGAAPIGDLLQRVTAGAN